MRKNQYEEKSNRRPSGRRSPFCHQQNQVRCPNARAGRRRAPSAAYRSAACQAPGRIAELIGQHGLESTIEDYLDSLEGVFSETKRVLKEDGALFVVIGDTYVDGSLQSIPHPLALRLMDLGFIQRNCLVWKKINPKPEGTTRRWSISIEFVFFFTQSLNHQFDIDAIRVPYKDDALSNAPGHRKLNGQMQMGTANFHHPLGKVPADYIETNVASINLDEDIEHPAMYPEELIEPFMKATTGKVDLVLDVFAGSGTTGVVALDLGRRFVGYEINGDFCKLCEQRLGSLNEVENTP